MLELGEQRVRELKARGFETCRYHNPRGVGGTHVVCAPRSQPELYHGLPKDPADRYLNPICGKGALKPLAAAGFIAIRRSDYHYIGIWPE